MTRWTVAHDAGRPEGRACGHLDGAGEGEPPARSEGCARCREAGLRWVHLRLCLTCGHVGCCDSSSGKHAASHAAASGHPLARSAEEGEAWAWCYEDELFLVPAAGEEPA
ncbi:UBP-type zinc finger domain-containing protein [Streptomyces sp. NPDC057939]|uniref:UBP-type zinc finger domain-containing protein n=1 Tax=Streptomyces sp. NPDC057939 TaxID=3346284 RepID=UPI0036E8E8FA